MGTKLDIFPEKPETNSNAEVILTIEGQDPSGTPCAKEGDEYQISVTPPGAMSFKLHVLQVKGVDNGKTVLRFEAVPGSLNAGECTIIVDKVGDETVRVTKQLVITKPSVRIRETTATTTPAPTADMKVVSPLSTPADLARAAVQPSRKEEPKLKLPGEPEKKPLAKRLLGLWPLAVLLLALGIAAYFSTSDSRKTAPTQKTVSKTMSQLHGGTELLDTKADEAKDEEAPATSTNEPEEDPRIIKTPPFKLDRSTLFQVDKNKQTQKEEAKPVQVPTEPETEATKPQATPPATVPVPQAPATPEPAKKRMTFTR